MQAVVAHPSLRFRLHQRISASMHHLSTHPRLPQPVCEITLSMLVDNLLFALSIMICDPIKHYSDDLFSSRCAFCDDGL